jgi:hypothetical protein
MLSDILLQHLQQRFPGRGLRTGSPPDPVAVFPAVHPEVGDIAIYDDGDELTLVAGRFSHAHYADYDDAHTPEEKATIAAEQVVAFLEEIFEDRVVLWGTHEGGGGWYPRTDTNRAQASGRYVWSGPLS